MAVVPNATALQVQLGDDDARTARGLAVLADMETRLAALGEISKPVHVLKFRRHVTRVTWRHHSDARVTWRRHSGARHEAVRRNGPGPATPRLMAPKPSHDAPPRVVMA